MIDRHHLACRPVRDLLVDYLRERQPGNGSLEQLARKLGMFWADLEAHHPGIDSLHLSGEVADAWKQRMRTKPKTITLADGTQTVVQTERICHREFLTPVRAFYLDLQRAGTAQVLVVQLLVPVGSASLRGEVVKVPD
jgi:hypothetical protein